MRLSFFRPRTMSLQSGEGRQDRPKGLLRARCFACHSENRWRGQRGGMFGDCGAASRLQANLVQANPNAVMKIEADSQDTIERN